MNYSVYILQSMKNGAYYKGMTDNISKRISKHNNGEVQSTKRYVPWKLVWSTQKTSKTEAAFLERKLKNITSRKRLEDFMQKYS